MIKAILEQQLTQIMTVIAPDWQGQVVLEPVKNEQFGDYSSSVGMVLAKQLKANPRQLAETIAAAIMADTVAMKWLERVSVEGPGFINFRLNGHGLWTEVGSALGELQEHSERPEAGQKVLIEFSSPNIAKPFNVGHLRSTIIGDSLAKIETFLGATVVRDNHLGDWGTQYGKLAYAVDTWGDWEAIAQNPIKELFELYVRFHREEETDPELVEKGRAYFKRLEEGDVEVVSTWKKLVDMSLVDFNALYQILKVEFDMKLGESFYEPYLAQTIQECKERGIARESQGAWLIFFDGHPELDTAPLMIQKSDGTSTYGTRDLAGIKYRFETFGLDKMVIEIGNEQRLYFLQVITAAEMLGWTKPGQLTHVGHGLFMLPTGKMSTRKGETVWVRELIEELEERSLQIIEQKSADLPAAEKTEVAKMVAIGALKYNDLSQNRLSNVIFDKEKSLALDGNSAPYLQYSVARGRKVLAKAGLTEHEAPRLTEWWSGLKDRPEQLSAQERSLLWWLGRFEEVVVDAGKDMLPSTLAQYLFQLAQRYSSFYQSEQILQAEGAVRQQRLLLVAMTVKTLVAGLGLLGIDSPQRM